MKKVLMSLGLLLPLAPIFSPVSSIHADTPAYAKWSQLAIKETQARYPNVNIVDYLHIGSTSEDGVTKEQFKLWLKDSKREFGVFVTITYWKDTEKLKDIEFRETDR